MCWLSRPTLSGYFYYNASNARVIFMKPAVFLTGFAVVVLGILALAFHEAVGDWFASLRPAQANSLQGEWVGMLNIASDRHSGLSNVPHQAAIRFNLKATDSFMKKYGGPGEITLTDGSPQALEIRDLKLESNSTDGSLRAGMWLNTYTPGQARTDHVSGGLKGSFTPGTLRLQRNNDEFGYTIEGTLTQGTDDDYRALVQRLR